MKTVIIRIGQADQAKIVVSKPKKQFIFSRFFRKQTPQLTISEQEEEVHDEDIHLQSLSGK